MVTVDPAKNGSTRSFERTLPPVSEMAIAAMILVIIGGIDIAARLPHQAPLLVPILTLVGAAALVTAMVVSLSRIGNFAWRTFFTVLKYAALAYIVIAGMLEFVFVLDDTRGTTLVILSLMLLIFAIDIPILFAFSVARYQPPD
jgi:hypothetical protein